MRFVLILVFCFFVNGCFLVPYKIEVQQGNYIDSSMISLLKLNMTRDQVVYILGTPLVTDPFNLDRWSYVYLEGQTGNTEKKRDITLIFKDDKLVRIEGRIDSFENGFNTSMLKLGITGASGQMGKALLEIILNDEDVDLCAAFDASSSVAIGKDVGNAIGLKTGINVGCDLAQGLDGCGVLIDFTRPAGTLEHLKYCVKLGIPVVIGTTGFSQKEQEAVINAAEKIPIVFAPNMSVGVNVMFNLVEIAAKALGGDFDAEILESHHSKKVDSPSGTALKMGNLIAEVTNRNLDENGIFSRHGNTGKRDPKSIGFATIRGGDVVGDHTAFCWYGRVCGDFT